MMSENTRKVVTRWFTGLWESLTFKNKKPHFSFITAHYLWIVGATIVASVMIFASGSGNVSYIDALMLASGANTQAGLNPVNLNLLNNFQQIVLYFFAMTSNPITLHGSVVILRLYWFEKRFQGWVRDARSRRGTLSKSKSQARNDGVNIEAGVNGRSISVMQSNGPNARLTNDGMLLEGDGTVQEKHTAHSDNSDSTAVTAEPTTWSDLNSGRITRAQRGFSMNSEQEQQVDIGDAGRHGHNTTNPHVSQTEAAIRRATPTDLDKVKSGGHHTRGGSHTAIKFADTVKKSDGVGSDQTKFPPSGSNAEHIAILQRQRDHDTGDEEVLRIPGPRDAERGSVPRKLQRDDAQEDEEDEIAMNRGRTVEPRPMGDNRSFAERPATITITEPERRRRTDFAADAKAMGHTFESLRIRKPRMLNRQQKKVHTDDVTDPDHDTLFGIKKLSTLRSALSRDKTDDMPYLSYNPTIGRNSNFIGLSLEEREELGGIEYRSLRTLALILIFYFWGWELLGLICFLPYILYNQLYGDVVERDGQNKTWWAFWTANSAFMDLGFTITKDSMNSFNTSTFVLMIMWLIIIVGNTGFPVALRFIIWVLAKIVPTGTGLWEELRFLLDHPRRCFTLLFPAGANWWLFWILVALNAIDLMFFIILDLGSGPISTLPLHVRVVEGLFQAASTRTAGFSCVNIAELHPAMPVLYIIMMYISVFPIAISIRRTNVYEEKSLGVYPGKSEEDDELNGGEASALTYVGTHLRRQLSFDLWYVFLGFFILSISEGGKIQAGDFDMFAVLFEIVSAYGTVGLSLGYSGGYESLSSQFSVVGKLVIIAMEIRGRHRALPYGLDRAVLLPSESRFQRETEDASMLISRTNTGGSGAISTGAQPRSSSAVRGRSRSRERPRTNSNLVTQFLHPGPIISHDSIRLHNRTRSVEPDGISLGPRRTRTQPSRQSEDEEGLAPLPSIVRPFSRRTDTS